MNKNDGEKSRRQVFSGGRSEGQKTITWGKDCFFVVLMWLHSSSDSIRTAQETHYNGCILALYSLALHRTSWPCLSKLATRGQCRPTSKVFSSKSLVADGWKPPNVIWDHQIQHPPPCALINIKMSSNQCCFSDL